MQIESVARLLRGEDIIFDDVTFYDGALNAQNIDTLTVHDTNFYGLVRETRSTAPRTGTSTISTGSPRCS
jgi:hypothetical protein